MTADFNHGKIEIDDIIFKREFIVSEEGDHLRLLHTEIYHKNIKPKATIAIFHGLGQGSDMFIETGIQYAMNGYKVEYIDFRGYGGSGGVRGDSTLIDLQKDIVLLLKEIDADIPLFVFAHSKGCMILTSFLMNNPDLKISGVVLIAPLTCPPENIKINTFRLIASQFLANNLPEMILMPRMNPSASCKKDYILKWYLSAKKASPPFGTKQAAMMLKYFQNYKYNVKSFKYPLLVHLGGDDKIVNNAGTKEIYEQFGTEDKQMFEYEGCFHDLQYEECQKEMFKNTLNWMNQKFKEESVSNFGATDFDKIKVAFLKKTAPFKQWKKLIFVLVVAYYLIGYLLMVAKFINKDRHEMIAFWPCSIFRKFFGKK